MSLPEEQPTEFLVHHAFADIDELSVVTRAWDLDFRQLHRGVFQGSLLQFGGAHFQMGRARLEGRVHQTGSTPVALRTFAVPACRELDLVWRGHVLATDQVLVFPPDGELDCCSGFDFDMFVLSVSCEALEQAADECGLGWNLAALIGAEVITCDPQAHALLQCGLMGLLSEVSAHSQSLTRPGWTIGLEQRITRLLVCALASSRHTRAEIDGGARGQQTEAAVRFACRAGSEPVTVSQLCREVGASERTLRRGFQERFGVSPKAFLKAQVLIATRRALRAADPDSLHVADIANRFGIWHLGQFAADYRKHFGELPSQTLQGLVETPASPE